MSKIKKREYVKFEDGNIRQIVGRDKDKYLLVDINIYGSNWLTFNEEANIIKHSKNILDLIEPGDIVNNHYVKAVYLDGAVKYIKLDNAYSPENHFTGVRTYEDDIKTILTKEQMEANQYVVKRNMETN